MTMNRPDLHWHRARRGLLAAAMSLVGVFSQEPAAAQAGPASRNAAAPARTDYIVAVVNRELVTAVELERRLELLAEEARRLPTASRPGPEELRRQALESLVEERAILTHARENGGRVEEADIDRAVQGVAAQAQLSLASLRERLAAEGLDMPRFRASLRDQLLVERTREREVSARIRITELEIDEYLQNERESRDRELEIDVAVPAPTTPSSGNPYQP